MKNNTSVTKRQYLFWKLGVATSSINGIDETMYVYLPARDGGFAQGPHNERLLVNWKIDKAMVSTWSVLS